MDGVKLVPYVDPKSKRWHVRVSVSGIEKRMRPSLGVPGDQDHTAALAAFEANVLPALVAGLRAAIAQAEEDERTAGHTTAGPTLRALADWFVRVHLPYLRRAPKTVDHYERTLNDFITYCSGRHVARAQQLSARIIQEWQLHISQVKGRDGVSRDQILAVKHWLETAQEAGELRDLPAIKWTIPKKTKSQRFKAYPREVIEPWLEGLRAWRPRAGLVVAWVDATGWRISDALDLRMDEIDRGRGEINRQQLKTAAALPYPLGPRLVELIDAALEGRGSPRGRDHVFLDHRGEPWEYQRLVKILDHYHASKWDGASLTFRDLRKSFGTHLAMGGCPPNVLKELMGHEDVTMTLEYYVSVDMAKMLEWSQWHTEHAEVPRQ